MALPHPPAPFSAPVSGDIDQRLAQIAEAINRKADATAPVFPQIALRAPNGTTYRVTVDNSGVLHTTAVARP